MASWSEWLQYPRHDCIYNSSYAFHAKAHDSQQPLVNSLPDGLSVVRHMVLQVPAPGPLVQQLEVAARVRSVELGDQVLALPAPLEAHGGRVGGAHEGLADVVEAVV